jgi:hypothetical protein
MTPEGRDAVMQALWPASEKGKLSVWGVLDCARDPRIYRALLESRLEFRCLYSGRLPRALEMVAPHLVELFPTNRLTATWLDEGWGQAWGVFMKIDDPSNLRHHLRKFLRVQDEDGRRLLFRWYDPRVLRLYLPTCTDAELQTVFGPTGSLLAESADASGLVEYTLVRGTLKQRLHAVGRDVAGMMPH